MDDLAIVEWQCSLSAAASKARRERDERRQNKFYWVASAICVVGVCCILVLTPWYI